MDNDESEDKRRLSLRDRNRLSYYRCNLLSRPTKWIMYPQFADRLLRYYRNNRADIPAIQLPVQLSICVRR